MAKKTVKEIQEILNCYAELGVYAQVAKKLGVSANTVSKYVKEAQNIQMASQPATNLFDKEIKNINEIPFPTDWQSLLVLSKEEWGEIKELQKEVYIN